jgi:hypothetical protein
MRATFNAQERTLRELATLTLTAGWKVVQVNRMEGALFAHLVAVPVNIPPGTSALSLHEEAKRELGLSAHGKLFLLRSVAALKRILRTKWTYLHHQWAIPSSPASTFLLRPLSAKALLPARESSTPSRMTRPAVGCAGVGRVHTRSQGGIARMLGMPKAAGK